MSLRYYYLKVKTEILYLSKNLRYLLTSKKKVIYIGCIGHNNLGDEGVFMAIKKLFKKELFIYPISYVKPSSGKYLRKLFVRNPDFIMLGGGTIIKKQANESYLRLLLSYHKSFPFADLVVFGAGVADPVLAEKVGFPTDDVAWRDILNKCKFVGVRGEISKETLEKWNVDVPVDIVYDPVIFFRRKKIQKKRKQKQIGVNFCNIAGRIYGQDQGKVKEFGRQLILRLINLGWKVHLFPTTDSDIVFMKSFLDASILKQVKVYERYKNLEKSLSFIENLDVFVGQRLHSIIFSSITYTPFYAIEYESKTSDYLSSIGFKNFISRTNSLDVDLALNRIEFLYKNIEYYQEELFHLINEAIINQRKSIAKFKQT